MAKTFRTCKHFEEVDYAEMICAPAWAYGSEFVSYCNKPGEEGELIEPRNSEDNEDCWENSKEGESE